MQTVSKTKRSVRLILQLALTCVVFAVSISFVLRKTGEVPHLSGQALPAVPNGPEHFVTDEYAMLRPSASGHGLDGEYIDLSFESKDEQKTQEFIKKAVSLFPDYQIAIDLEQSIPSERLLEILQILYRCGVRKVLIQDMALSLTRDPNMALPPDNGGGKR